ncbi:MAG: D-alanine--D-alanine ligase [Oscillospiraceae bacterium]|jgi:D-alanine-D-alanine ligase|nr:D-alanine--D-alanine ligase [Oscillospiraceae bacterium]
MKQSIAVIFGGKSVEHEISVISAVQAMAALDKDRFEIFPVFIAKDGAFWHGPQLRDMAQYKDLPALLRTCVRADFTTSDGKVYLIPAKQKAIGKTKPIALLDAALPIVHGTNVEDGALQGYLKTLGLPFAGCDVLASAVCMDKYVMKVMLRAGGFPVLDGLRVQAAQGQDTIEIIAEIEQKFAYPVIVKPVNLGSSIGIGRAADAEELADALETAFTFANTVLVEPCVQNLREINCAVLGDSESACPSECEEPILNADGWLDYEKKYLQGSNGKGNKSAGGAKAGMASLSRKIPADITPQTRKAIQDCAVGAFRYLDCCGVARIDFLTDGATGEFWLNELNTIPGSLSFYLWEPIGLPYGKLLEELIALALKRERRQSEITYSFDTNILASQGSFGAKSSKV